MADTYSEVYYHFIWSTKNRAATITADKEPKLQQQPRIGLAELTLRLIRRGL